MPVSSVNNDISRKFDWRDFQVKKSFPHSPEKFAVVPHNGAELIFCCENETKPSTIDDSEIQESFY